jgi:hypothetical protein
MPFFDNTYSRNDAKQDIAEHRARIRKANPGIRALRRELAAASDPEREQILREKLQYAEAEKRSYERHAEFLQRKLAEEGQ